MTHLLDTNVCVDVLRRKTAVGLRLAGLDPSRVAVSVITQVELLVGAALSRLPEVGRQQVARLLGGIRVLDVDPDVAAAAVLTALALRRVGRPLGDFDLLIAATALTHDLTLVTRDRDFARIPGLRLEDWTL